MKAIADRLNAASRRLPEWGTWLAGLLPLAWLIVSLFGGAPPVDPVRVIEHHLGTTGLWFLFATLALPPLRALSGINLLRHRRALGLLAFFYITMHIAAWIWLDMGLLWPQLLNDLVRRPWLLMGAGAFLMLAPLALTSNMASIRRLGAKWRILHRLVWPASFLAVLHALWQMKIITREGWIWLAIFLALLGWRVIPAKIRARR